MAQKGKYAVTGEEFTSKDDIHYHHIIPKSKGGTDDYQNLILVKETVNKLIHATNAEIIQKYLQTCQPDMKKLNVLRKQVGNNIEESWDKATTEKSYKMENTYHYPTAAEMEDIKAAYEYLFDSIRFKEHDKTCELYSASIENVSEKLKETRLMSETELTMEQLALQKMREEVFGIK